MAAEATWPSPTISEAAYFLVLVPLLSPQGLGLRARDRAAGLRRCSWTDGASCRRPGAPSRRRASSSRASPFSICFGGRCTYTSMQWGAVSVGAVLVAALPRCDSRWRASDVASQTCGETPAVRPSLAIVLLAPSSSTRSHIRREMIDFLTWRQAVVRALDAEPLYRPEDGHYQFKYLPLFALLMAPFGVARPGDREDALVRDIESCSSWLSLRWSVRRSYPISRLSQRTLVVVRHPPDGEVLRARTAARTDQPPPRRRSSSRARSPSRARSAGLPPVRSSALAVFVKPYALILAPWLVVTQGWPAAAMAAGVVALGLLLPAVGVWLERQPGSAGRMAAHRRATRRRQTF